MSYPSVFCVKCKNHTDTLGRHTIQLSNNRRALKGVCPVCATETYRFMPEKGKSETQLSLISSQRKIVSEKDQAKNKDRDSKPKPEVQLRSQPRSALVERFRPQAPVMSRVDFVHYGAADKLLHYGILMILFGLSAVIGYVLCAELFLK